MSLPMKHLVTLLITGALFIGIMFGAVLFKPEITLSSVSATNEYLSTTTAANILYGNTITGDKLLKTGQGAFGSVIITGANTGNWHVYNATTTSVLLRTDQKATSTILLATFPASLAAGTYTFDIQFTDGLLLELDAGNMPTSTVTWR